MLKLGSKIGVFGRNQRGGDGQQLGFTKCLRPEEFAVRGYDPRPRTFTARACGSEFTVQHPRNIAVSNKKKKGAGAKVYEGVENMKESRQDMLRQNFNIFDYIPRETLETQLQRFTTLTTEMNIAGIFLSKSEINKKLLNSLPKSWDMNVAIIKKTKDLNHLSLTDVIQELDGLKCRETMSSKNIPVTEVTYTLACEATIKFLREQIDLFKREVEDLRYEGYQLRKGQKPMKAELEAKTKDFRKLQEEQLAAVTEELDTLKIKCGKTDVSFKNYTASSIVAEDENKESSSEQTNDPLNSKFVASNQPAVSKYMPPFQAKQSACCNYACGKNKRKGKDMPPGTGRDNFTVKKKTCFHCGTPGHIARCCPNHAYVPYCAQGWQNAPRGRFFKRNPSRSHSDIADWNSMKAKNSIPKAKHPNPKGKKDMSANKPNPRDAQVKQRPVRSNSSQRPTSRSKPSAEAPIRSNKKWVKHDYKWVPKVQSPKSVNDSNISTSSVCDKQDMSWERVPCIDDKGRPGFKMDWVPKTN
uniref:CCHC-type domain-containing protein n=1 Tax=Lactuca sativa TaxID=4236 RepID=A0A9R1UQF4_LACSA|nr:hypothetical protein LSAT_V11C800412810 [Lactuca sativa]